MIKINKKENKTMDKQFFLITDDENQILGKLELSINSEKREKEMIKFFNDLINDDKHEFLQKFGFLFPRFQQKIQDIDILNKRDFQVIWDNHKQDCELIIWGDDGLISFNIIELTNIKDLTTLNEML